MSKVVHGIVGAVEIVAGVALEDVTGGASSFLIGMGASSEFGIARKREENAHEGDDLKKRQAMHQ